MAEFKAGDKVVHRSLGAGEIVYGPYENALGGISYLMTLEGGRRRHHASPERLTLRPQFTAGDRVYTEDGPGQVTFGPVTWDRDEPNGHYLVTADHSGEAFMMRASEIRPLGPPALAVGDTVRVLTDYCYGAGVVAGDQVRVAVTSSDCEGSFVVEHGADRWYFKRTGEGIDWERV